MLFLVCSGGAAAAALDVQVDRARIVEGETVILTVTSPGDSWGIPELGPLADDFEVENQGQSTSTTIVNGLVSTKREWRFLLVPKRSGRLSIPALKIGDHESEPVQLEVLPASEAARLGETLPVMVEAEVDQDSPYVQGQVIYTVRVLVRVKLQQATLEDPKADGVTVERLGEDRSYETYRDGQRYKVIERRFALFAQHSGLIEVSPPVLAGGIPETRQSRGSATGPGSPGSAFERFFGRDPFEDMGGLFQRTRPVQVRGPVLRLDVRPQPDGSPAPWLPAESLQLADTWAPDLSELRVGEPITRTIAITAKGLSAAQLPDLPADVPDGVKLYPDKPRLETRAEGDNLVAIKEVKQALVPSVEGTLTLPELRLAWWDTLEDRERVAALPERVVQVLPARTGAVTSVPSPPAVEPPAVQEPSDTLPLSALKPPGEEAPAEGPVPAAWSAGGFPYPAGYWPWLSAGLGLLWLIAAVLWLRERGRRRRELMVKQRRREQAPAPSLSAARSLVRRSCETNDPRAARDALIAWAGVCWSAEPPARLESLARRFGGPAGDALRSLDRSIYSSDSGSWDGGSTWDLLRPAIARAESERSDEMQGHGPLPPLYPQQG